LKKKRGIRTNWNSNQLTENPTLGNGEEGVEASNTNYPLGNWDWEQTPKAKGSDNEIKKAATGTGKMTNLEYTLLKESKDYKAKDFLAYKAYKFIDLPYKNNKKMTIFVPNNLKNNSIDKLYANLNIEIVYLNRKDLPQLVKDFIRTLSLKNIKSVIDITRRIKSFNYNIVRKLEDLENPKLNIDKYKKVKALTKNVRKNQINLDKIE